MNLDKRRHYKQILIMNFSHGIKNTNSYFTISSQNIHFVGHVYISVQYIISSGISHSCRIYISSAFINSSFYVKTVWEHR